MIIFNLHVQFLESELEIIEKYLRTNGWRQFLPRSYCLKNFVKIFSVDWNESDLLDYVVSTHDHAMIEMKFKDRQLSTGYFQAS